MFSIQIMNTLGFSGGLSGKEPIYQCRQHERLGLHPWVRKIPWRRKWQPTPIFFLENPTDRGAWWATVYGVVNRHNCAHAHTQPHQKNHKLLVSYQAHSNRYKFSKILIFTWKLWILLWATNTVSCFSWSDRLTWLIFVNMSASYVSLNEHSSPITYPLKLKWCFMKTEASLAHNSIIEVLFFQTVTECLYAVEMLYARIPLCHIKY